MLYKEAVSTKEDPLRQKPVLILSFALGLLVAFGAPQHGVAQSNTFSIALMGGLGGSFDAEPDTGLDNTGLQVRFTMELDLRTDFAVRVGKMDLEGESSVPGLFDSELTYLTLAGEYAFPAGYYESGLFIGLGLYDLSGDLFIPDEDGIGLTVGASGEFRITDRFFAVVEFSGHYADLDYAQFFAMGHAGVGFRF